MGALTTPVDAWGRVIRAESTSLSLTVLTLACGLSFVRGLWLGPRHAVAWSFATIVAGSACAFARDTNPFLILLLLAAVGIWVWFSRRRSPLTRPALLGTSLALVFTLGAAAFAGQWTARAAPRFDFPLMNVLFKRVLPNPDKRDYFVSELGMPMSPALMTRAGKFASVREALQYFSPVVGYIPRREGSRSTTAFTSFADDHLVAGALVNAPLRACGVFLIVGALSCLLRSLRARVLGAFLVFLVLAVGSQLFLGVHGDAMEVARHSVAVGLLLRLATPVCAALIVSGAVELGCLGLRSVRAQRAEARARLMLTR